MPRYNTLGVVVDESTLANNPELVRKFLRAWTKGLDWAIHNQKEAVALLRKRYPAINKAEGLANLAEIARISQSDDTRAHGLGWQDPAVWEAQEAFMRDAGLITKKVDVSKAMTNEYLPGKP